MRWAVGIAADGDEGGHHLPGQAGQHDQGEAGPDRVAVPHVAVEGGEQDGRHRQPDGEQGGRAAGTVPR